MKLTREQVLQLALEVDIDPHDMCEDPRIAENNLERLFTLAYEAGRKDENEACAKLLEATDLSGLKGHPEIQVWVANILFAYTNAIRARGQHD